MKKIEFITNNKNVLLGVSSPKPAQEYIPQWYKDSKSFFTSNSISFDKNLNMTKTAKLCIPVLDSMTSGYIQETWTDIYIERNGKEIKYVFADSSIPIFSSRDKRTIQNMPIPTGHLDILFHWNRVWCPKVPNGYSVLFKHPSYRDDLPFTSISGIIDSDEFILNGKVGFFIKDNFTGLIPKGTPMYQMIPFKRDDWKSESRMLEDEEKDNWHRIANNITSVFTGGYKKKYWKRKKYT
jgi:hypothetical protein